MTCVHETYDVAIVGAGLSGLTLARHLVEHGPPELRLAVVDPVFRRAPARTWCFWGGLPELVRPPIERTWTHLRVSHGGRIADGELHGNPYHMVAGQAFSSAAIDALAACPRVSFIQGHARSVTDADRGAVIRLDDRLVASRWAFQSLPPPSSAAMRQHFGGWEIQTEVPAFDAGRATLMDFDPARRDATAFYYVLPLAPDRALVEYTVFSSRPVHRSVYDSHVRRYIREKVTGPWRVVRKEYGVIPMDPDPPGQRGGRHVFNIGRAGGLTKATTGYTFRRVFDQAAHFTRTLNVVGRPEPLPPRPRRFSFYDRLLLDVLREQPGLGPEIFFRLFHRNPFDRVLTFLDERSSLMQEAALFASLPIRPFLGSLFDGRRRERSQVPI